VGWHHREYGSADDHAVLGSRDPDRSERNVRCHWTPWLKGRKGKERKGKERKGKERKERKEGSEKTLVVFAFKIENNNKGIIVCR
jgi:hypothetical protein